MCGVTCLVIPAIMEYFSTSLWMLRGVRPPSYEVSFLFLSNRTKRKGLLSFLSFRYFAIHVFAPGDKKTSLSFLPLPLIVNSSFFRLMLSILREAISLTLMPVEKRSSRSVLSLFVIMSLWLDVFSGAFSSCSRSS